MSITVRAFAAFGGPNDDVFTLDGSLDDPVIAVLRESCLVEARAGDSRRTLLLNADSYRAIMVEEGE